MHTWMRSPIRKSDERRAISSCRRECFKERIYQFYTRFDHSLMPNEMGRLWVYIRSGRVLLVHRRHRWRTWVWTWKLGRIHELGWKFYFNSNRNWMWITNIISRRDSRKHRGRDRNKNVRNQPRTWYNITCNN